MLAFVITLLVVIAAVVGLGVSTFFSKKKKFPETHVGSNKAMQQRGIRCVFDADREEREKARDKSRPR
jgi:flagellar basal body-associated protein FliL